MSLPSAKREVSPPHVGAYSPRGVRWVVERPSSLVLHFEGRGLSLPRPGGEEIVKARSHAFGARRLIRILTQGEFQAGDLG